MSELDPVHCALDLMRRLPPQKLENNLEALCDILPEQADLFYSNIERPLSIGNCEESGKPYLCYEFNRDMDSFRSPWSNQYYPAIETDIYPPTSLRSLEIAFNEAFEVYTKLYYESGVSSVYLWEDKNGFSGAALIKKVNDSNKRVRGAWDSIHVFNAEVNATTVDYKLTSSILLYTMTTNQQLGTMNLAGSIRRSTKHQGSVHHPTEHIVQLGQLIEDMESKIRNTLSEVYFQKTKDIVNHIRTIVPKDSHNSQFALQESLASKLKSMAMPSKDDQDLSA